MLLLRRLPYPSHRILTFSSFNLPPESPTFGISQIPIGQSLNLSHHRHYAAYGTILKAPTRLLEAATMEQSPTTIYESSPMGPLGNASLPSAPSWKSLIMIQCQMSFGYPQKLATSVFLYPPMDKCSGGILVNWKNPSTPSFWRLIPRAVG